MALWQILLAMIWVCLLLIWWVNIAKKRQKQRLLPGSKLARDRRRSNRVLLSVPVFVYGWATDTKTFINITKTLSVSLHGGLVALAATARPGQIVLLANIHTDEEKRCRIVRVGPEHNGLRDVGFEFLNAE